ncbi:MAG: hypothetical protein Cons2KO_28010 [Congregibacter sp.]
MWACTYTIGLSVAAGSTGAIAQATIDVAPGTTSLFVTPEDFPSGVVINVAGGVSAGEIIILPVADPVDLESSPPFEININGSVGSATNDTQNFDLNAFVASEVNIGTSGFVSNLALNGGATVTNNGSIAMAPADSGLGGTTLLLSDPFNATSGATSSFNVTNNGSISVSGENLGGGIFGNTIVAFGGNATVPAAVSLNLNNTGTISLGPDTTGTLVRWREADDVVITNSGTFNVGFTPIAGGLNSDPIIFLRDRSQAPGLDFDDNMSITNEASGQLIGARVFLGSPFDGSQSYNLTFTNNGSVLASGSDVASPVAPGGAAFEIGGLSTFTNSGNIRIDGSLLDGGNGSGEFLDHFVELGAVPEQSDFDAQQITFVNTASGLIDATGEGIEFQSGSVTNNGTIIARGEENGYGVLAFVPSLVATSQDLWNDSLDVSNTGLIQAGFVGVSKELGVVNMNLSNSGTIEIIQDTAFNPSAVLIAEGSMSIINEASGVIRGPTAISGAGDSLTIDNSGLIEGAIRFSGATTLESSGSIVGDVDLGDDVDTVASGGSIDGAVSLGGGDDTFTALGGLAVTDTVDAGSGFDVLRFANASLSTGANSVSAEFLGFEETRLSGNVSLADGVANTTSLPTADVVFEADVVFAVDALENGNGDLLSTTGTIALNGGQVLAVSDDGAWSVARDYTIIQADSGLSGTFDSASSNQIYLDAALSYSANSVVLSLERIDGLIQGDILETTNAQQLSVAARVVPEIIQTQVSNSILSLLGSSTSGVASTGANLVTGLSAGDEMGGATGSAWLNLTPTRYDQRAVLPGATGLQKIDGETVNFLAGVDRLIGSRYVAGAFLGYEDSEVDYRAISGFQENTGYLIGAYGGVAFNDWLYSSINLNWAQLDNDLEERAFDAPQAQRASFDSERLSLGVDLTAVTQRGNLSYLAKAAYNYSKESYDAYRTGRGEIVQLRDLSLGRLSITGEASYQGERWNPYVSLGYEYDANVSKTVTDDSGFVVNAGLRTVRGERLAFEAYVTTVTGRNNENQELIGFNVNYAF